MEQLWTRGGAGLMPPGLLDMQMQGHIVTKFNHFRLVGLTEQPFKANVTNLPVTLQSTVTSAISLA